MPGWPVAFRGSWAVAAGLVTWDVLAGQRFTRFLPDVYGRVGGEPDPLRHERAAYALVAPAGVLAGYSAATVLGADCAPRHAPAEVVARGARVRSRPGLVVRRDVLEPDEITHVGGLRVTTARRTGFDLGRRAPDLRQAVVVIDALARVGGFDPSAVLALARRHPGARGLRLLREAVPRADRRSGSPMETRLRLLLADAGLPAPELQFPVQDPVTRTAVWLDLAYPEQLVGIEFEGPDHLTPQRVRRDIRRATALVDRGWRLYRLLAADVYTTPDRTVQMISRALHRSDHPD